MTNSSFYGGDPDIRDAIHGVDIFVKQAQSSAESNTTTVVQNTPNNQRVPQAIQDGRDAANILRGIAAPGPDSVGDAVTGTREYTIGVEDALSEQGTRTIQPSEPAPTTPSTPAPTVSSPGTLLLILTAVGTAAFFLIKKAAEGAANRAGEDFYDNIRGKQKAAG